MNCEIEHLLTWLLIYILFWEMPIPVIFPFKKMCSLFDLEAFFMCFGYQSFASYFYFKFLLLLCYLPVFIPGKILHGF